MKRTTLITIFSMVVAIGATVAWGEVFQTPLDFQVGTPTTLGGAQGMTVEGNGFGTNLPDGGTVLYDNTVGPSVGFFDWTAPGAAWGDDLHELSAQSPPGWTPVITSIAYAYYNTGGGGGVVTHTIKLYDMVPPSGTHGSSSVTGFHPVVDEGPLAGVVTIPGLSGVGSFSVAVTGLSIPLAGSAAWIKFNEAAPNTSAGPTFWLSGGVPVVGYSHDTLGYDAGAGPMHYSHIFAPYSNIMMRLGGFHIIPEPASIGLLGLAGLLVLVWRRRVAA